MELRHGLRHSRRPSEVLEKHLRCVDDCIDALEAAAETERVTPTAAEQINVTKSVTTVLFELAG